MEPTEPPPPAVEPPPAGGDDDVGADRGLPIDIGIDAPTPAGGSGPSASVTDWDVIHDARGDGQHARWAMDRLSRRYWPAVYAYLRRTGRDPDAAADLTQGFLCDVLLDGGLVERADPGRGRFRTFLFTSLRNYVIQRHRHEHRHRRHPGTVIRPMPPDHGPGGDASIVSSELDPARAFTCEWGRTLVRASLERAATECRRSGLEAHWHVFEHRVARPLLEGTPPRSYQDLVADLELDDAAQAANMMITGKRRFARALRAEIARTVADPSEVDAEIAELLRDLGTAP